MFLLEGPDEISSAAARYAGSRELLSLSRWGRAQYDEWAMLLHRLGVSPGLVAALLTRAEQADHSLPEELLASGIVDEETLYRAIAVKLAIPYRDTVRAADLRITAEEAMTVLREGHAPLAQLVGKDGFILYVVAPRLGSCAALRPWLARLPAIAGRVSLTRPAVLRRALVEVARERLAERARDGLFVGSPRLSARIVTGGWQGALLGAGAVATVVGALLTPAYALLAIHASATTFFFGCVVLRLGAIFARLDRPSFDVHAIDRKRLPTYSILIALRDEVEVIPELLASLSRIEWPRARLEVKFVCEDDDRPTIEALQAVGLKPWAEIVEVPRGMPGTKPNALSYALQLTRGEFVAVYDAEDRPHPQQLLEAWSRFEREDESLACLQAPLDIDNGRAGVVPRLFALEYAALFRRFLPYLAAKGCFLPLGGTSNHFRRTALETVGGWDPYNVTEDADLGLRLARFGYRCGIISSPTGEDAPIDHQVWVRQRTRWLKGWGQTWLVHMREPGRLLRELGLRSFLAVQLLMAGVLFSSLVHPLMLVTGAGLAGKAIATGELTPMQFALFSLDAFNIVLGYASFLVLGWQASRPSERRGFWKAALFTPIYWLMMSLAAWRALEQLWTRPHHWEKTPHWRHGAGMGS